MTTPEGNELRRLFREGEAERDRLQQELDSLREKVRGEVGRLESEATGTRHMNYPSIGTQDTRLLAANRLRALCGDTG